MRGASYLAGASAANASRTRSVAILFAYEAPFSAEFSDGFTEGVRSVDPSVNVTIGYVAKTDDGFNRPDIAHTIEETLYRNGTDVVYTAAGGSNAGVIAAAGESTGRYVIGTDVT